MTDSVGRRRDLYARAWYNHMVKIIIKNRDILGGTPVFRGTRVPIQTLFDYLEGGETLEDFLEGFLPSLVIRPSLHSKKQSTFCSHVPKCAF